VRGARAERDDRAAGGREAGQDDQGAAATCERRAETFLRTSQAAGAGDGAVQALPAAPGQPVRHQVAEDRGRRGAEGQREEVRHVRGRDVRHVHGRRAGTGRGRRRRRDDEDAARQYRQKDV
jgi:hypothetical protein